MQQTGEHLLSLFPFTPTPEQKNLFEQVAVFLNDNSAGKSVFLLTGYAGTGKTTCLKALYTAAKKIGYRLSLLAPTGRSAKIISKNTKQKAHTLHREIYQQTRQPYSGAAEFKLKRNYKKKCLFIVDEASMISGTENENGRNLLADLISFVFENPGNKLILTGDSAQLPPAGEPLSLALDTEILQYVYQLKVSAVQLKEVSRQQQGSGILLNATALRNTLQNRVQHFRFQERPFRDFFLLPEEKLMDGLTYAYEKYGQGNAVLICATNRESFHFNRKIREIILKRTSPIEKGELLIVNRNNYNVLPGRSKLGFLANGEFAEVVEVNEEESYGSFGFINLVLRLPDYPKQAAFSCKILKETLLSPEASLDEARNQELFKLILDKYSPIKTRSRQVKAIRQDPYLNSLHVKYAYALTCHKAQGGQWGAVFVHQGVRQQKNFTTDKIRWLYTALTRAVKELYLIES